MEKDEITNINLIINTENKEENNYFIIEKNIEEKNTSRNEFSKSFFTKYQKSPNEEKDDSSLKNVIIDNKQRNDNKSFTFSQVNKINKIGFINNNYNSKIFNNCLNNGNNLNNLKREINNIKISSLINNSSNAKIDSIKINKKNNISNDSVNSNCISYKNKKKKKSFL